MRAESLARARWLTSTRIAAYLPICLAVYAIVIVGMLATSPHLIDPFGKPIGTDFMSTWSAGKPMLSGERAAAYDYARHCAVQRDALPWATGQEVPFFPCTLSTCCGRGR